MWPLLSPSLQSKREKDRRACRYGEVGSREREAQPQGTWEWRRKRRAEGSPHAEVRGSSLRGVRPGEGGLGDPGGMQSVVPGQGKRLV